MDEQMIELIARAMAADHSVRHYGLTDGGWEANTDYGRSEWLHAARAAHSVIAGKVAELEELIDELVERGLGCGAFDDEPDPLWAKAANATGRDPDTGNRAALAPYPERRHD